MTTRPIYLDWNATAPLRPAAREAMVAALDDTGNASSVHSFGRRAKAWVEQGRGAVAALVGAAAPEVVFTGGGTEANAAAIAAASWARVLVSAIEHDSVLAARSDAERIAVTPAGIVDLEALQRMLSRGGGPTLVSVMLANNETGVVQPLTEVVRIARAAGARVHTDTIQAAGKMPVDAAALGIDYLSLAAHKLGGPQGVGALILRREAPFAAAQRGGGQERGRRAGTENVPGIAGFGAAAEIAAHELGAWERVRLLRDRIESSLRALVPDAIVVGEAAPRLANTTCVVVPGLAAQTHLMALDLAGIAVSSGAACSSGKVRPSHVLAAMGMSGPRLGEAVRISLGWSTGEAEIESLLASWRELFARLSLPAALRAAA